MFLDHFLFEDLNLVVLDRDGFLIRCFNCKVKQAAFGLRLC